MDPMHRASVRRQALRASMAIAAALALSAGGMAGCAASRPGKASPPERKSGTQAVKVSEQGELAGLAGAVKTEEDRLILDLLLDYRQLVLAAPGPNALDKAAHKRGRDAYERLETILRHGGVKAGAADGGERIYTITDEEKLSLQEVIRSAEKAASQAAREGDWDKARARWKEITQSKPAVTRAMEEAQWGLALSDALQSSLPDSSKRRLKNLNDSYVAEVAYDEIGRQVKAILETGPEVRLQRELKKLANRAWERDKKAGRLPVAGAGEATTTPDAIPGSDELPPPASGTPGAPAAASPDKGETGSREAGAEADSLAAQGKYVSALKALERAGDQPWVKEKKVRFGEQFCEEKRRSAANSFMEFKKARSEAVRRAQLNRTASDLDSCLFYFPDLSVTQKVRKNREMVEGELKKLKP